MPNPTLDEAMAQAASEVAPAPEAKPEPAAESASGGKTEEVVEKTDETPKGETSEFETDLTELANQKDGFKKLQQKWGPKLARLAQAEKELADLKPKAMAWDNVAPYVKEDEKPAEKTAEPAKPDELDADTKALLDAYPGLRGYFERALETKVKPIFDAMRGMEEAQNLKEANEQIGTFLKKNPEAEKTLTSDKFLTFMKERPGLNLDEAYFLYQKDDLLAKAKKDAMEEISKDLKKKGAISDKPPGVSAESTSIKKPMSFEDSWAQAKRDTGL